MAELTYGTEAASAYDRLFGQVSQHFVPPLLRAAQVRPGMRVLDIATGTGLAAEAALAAVGSAGHVTAADISSAMVEKARERLGRVPNATVAVQDGQALSLPDESFEAVLCSMGLMFFPDPAKGLAEFLRVLRSGGRAAVSVNTVPERSFNGRINVAIGRYVPSLAAAASRVFSLGSETRLRALFDAAGFREVQIGTESHRFMLPSFDAYFDPVERGGASSGQAYIGLPYEVRRAVREEIRRELHDAGGPIEIEVEVRIASGVR